MEAVRQEVDPPTGMSSSSSSFRSYANTPRRARHPKGVADVGHHHISPPNPQWISHFMTNFFVCELCKNIVIEPQQLLPKALLVCKHCVIARQIPSDSLIELPRGLRMAFDEVEELHRQSMRNGDYMNGTPRQGAPLDDSIVKRRVVRAKRAGPFDGADGASPPLTAATATAATAATAAAAAAAATAAAAAAAALPEGVRRASPSHAAKQSPMPRAARSPSRQQTHHMALSQLDMQELDDSEIARRSKIEAVESTERVELMKRHAASVRNIQGRVRGSSKMLKAEADVKYEEAEFTMALELYTKAIEQQPIDRLTRLSILHGNRSSACFMAQRYADCIIDCMKVIELDPDNVRIYARAAKAAAVMGDLSRALNIMESIPEALVTDSIQGEWKKYKQGLEIYQRAERAFGLPEGEEPWLMLVAQFSDTIPFRLRYAESLMKQKRYTKAVETLEVVSASRRAPKIWYMMAQCLYLSGFEYFEKARTCLAEAQQLDENCANLLRIINVVDEGKQKGNMLFQKKKFAAAVDSYTAAIQAAENNEQILRILHCNRAAAHKELGKYREGIEDCTKALQLDSQFSKAYARRARCHQMLNDFTAAIRDFKSAIQYDPSDHELGRELRGCEQHLAKELERAKDYYYVLGVNRTSSEREIKLKYRELSLRWHPDKCMSLPDEERLHAEQKFKIIGEAHATLIDPVRRREYDLKMDRERLTRSGGFGGATTYSGDAFRGQPSRYRSAPGGFW